MNLSTPQYVLPDYVCPFAVRVAQTLSLADFLGSMVTCAVGPPRGEDRTIGHQLRVWICLHPSKPKAFNARVRKGATVSLLRLHITVYASCGILTASAIAFAVRLRLRTRLTPG